MKRLYRHLLIGGLLASAGLASFAQGSPSPAPSDTTQPAAKANGTHFSSEQRERFHQKMSERHTQRLGQIKNKLKLTPDQTGAWDSFMAAIQSQDKRAPGGDREALSKLSTPERIDRMNSLMSEHQEKMRQRGEASKKFYSVLTDEQKKVFDNEMMPPHQHRNSEHS